MVSPHFSHSMWPAPVQEADRVGAARSAMWAHRASAATHPVGFFNRPFGLPFGGHFGRRAAQPYVPIRFSPPDAVSASPKGQRRPHGV